MTDYEHIGQFIFGAQRLDFSLAALCHHLAGSAFIPGEPDQDPASTLAQRMAVAEAYFAANKTGPALVEQFKTIANSVHALERKSRAPGQNGFADLDQALASMRDTQRSLAELAQALRVPPSKGIA